ncbi:MAG: zf-HC2 domain-containing protein [Acidobacteria bacterium]|nr:zf-HC2 domain-containing protein [Acidobacteriota bacterium]
MNCKKAQIRLQSFLDEDLSEREAQQLRSHLETCPTCAAVKRDFELLTHLARNELTAKAPEDFDCLFQRRLDASGQRRQRRSWLPAPLAWSAASVAVLILFVLTSFFPTNNQPVTSPSSPSYAPVRVTQVVLPADPGTPGTHVFVPGEQDGMLVRVPSTVKITRKQLTQDFFLSEVSH